MRTVSIQGRKATGNKAGLDPDHNIILNLEFKIL